MHIDSNLEFWQARASLVVSDGAGRPLSLPADVRTYLMASTQHGPAARPEAGICQQLNNPANQSTMVRALMARLIDWSRTGKAPPDSRYPTLASGALVRQRERRWLPDLGPMGVAFPAVYNTLTVVDHGTVPPRADLSRRYRRAVPAHRRGRARHRRRAPARRRGAARDAQRMGAAQGGLRGRAAVRAERHLCPVRARRCRACGEPRSASLDRRALRHARGLRSPGASDIGASSSPTGSCSTKTWRAGSTVRARIRAWRSFRPDARPGAGVCRKLAAHPRVVGARDALDQRRVLRGRAARRELDAHASRRLREHRAREVDAAAAADARGPRDDRPSGSRARCRPIAPDHRVVRTIKARGHRRRKGRAGSSRRRAPARGTPGEARTVARAKVGCMSCSSRSLRVLPGHPCAIVRPCSRVAWNPTLRPVLHRHLQVVLRWSRGNTGLPSTSVASARAFWRSKSRRIAVVREREPARRRDRRRLVDRVDLVLGREAVRDDLELQRADRAEQQRVAGLGREHLDRAFLAELLQPLLRAAWS